MRQHTLIWQRELQFDGRAASRPPCSQGPQRIALWPWVAVAVALAGGPWALGQPAHRPAPAGLERQPLSESKPDGQPVSPSSEAQPAAARGRPAEAQSSSAPAAGALAGTNLPHNLAGLSNALLRPIGSNTFALGAIQLNVRERTIGFPAVVNMEAGLIEYLLVSTFGKTHESLLRTEVSPLQIQLALLLLGARGAGTNQFPQAPSEPLPGDPLTIELLWTDNGQPKRIRAEEAVRDRRRRAPAQRGPWVYTGSRVIEGRFIAELVGSIVAIMEDPDAMINNPRPGREDDENWHVIPGVLPPLESPVQVVIKLETGPARP